MPDKKDYWFPAKLYGWGWGFPTVWQGWLVFVCYALGIAAIFCFVPPTTHAFPHTLLFLGLTLIAVDLLAQRRA